MLIFGVIIMDIIHIRLSQNGKDITMNRSFNLLSKLKTINKYIIKLISMAYSFELESKFSTPRKLYDYTEHLPIEFAKEIKEIEDKYNTYYYKLGYILPYTNIKNNFITDILKVITKYNTRIVELRCFYVLPFNQKILTKENSIDDEDSVKYVLECDTKFKTDIDNINHTYLLTNIELGVSGLLTVLSFGYYFLKPKIDFLNSQFKQV